MPYQSIYTFAQRLQDLGGDVNLVKLSSSSHLGLSDINLDYHSYIYALLPKNFFIEMVTSVLFLVQML